MYPYWKTIDSTRGVCKSLLINDIIVKRAVSGWGQHFFFAIDNNNDIPDFCYIHNINQTQDYEKANR
jgi:hypothetical protein